MRSFLVLGFLILFLIVGLPVYLIMKLIGVFNRRAGAIGSQAVVAWAFRIILWLAGCKMTVLGQENIPRDRPVLFTSNHRSYADVPMAYTTVGVPTGFVAKKEIRNFIGLSWWMTNMNCLFMDRQDMKQSLKTILQAIDNVKAGFSMFIMPEGTRNHKDEMLPFKEGSFKIAEKAGCPVVPVAITNSDAIYELHKPSIRKAKTVIHYGEPIETAGLSRDEFKTLGVTVRTRIEEMLKEDAKYVS